MCRFATDADARSESVLTWRRGPGDTTAAVITRTAVPSEEPGSDILLNDRYAALGSAPADGARVGLIPVDMQLLNKRYFDPRSGEEHEE